MFTRKAAAASAPDLSAQLQSLPIAMLTIRPDRSIAMVNAAAENLLGTGQRKLCDRLIGTILDFEDQRICRALKQNDSYFSARDTLVRARNSQENFRRMDIALSPVNQFDGWQTLIMSETASAGTQMFDDLDEIRKARIGAPDILAHEIKNPLAAIKGAAQLIERKAEAQFHNLTVMICSEVERIAALIDQMQNLSSRSRADCQPCNIYESIARARSVIEAAHPQRLAIEEVFDPSIPDILGVEDHLVQILLNLMTNAIEASRSVAHPKLIITTRFVSGVTIRLAGESESISLPVEIRISDNGPGVPADIAADIFNPFVTSKEKGQGLGLALVNKLVRDMNARISHERDMRSGLTHFRLFLPLAPVSAPGRSRQGRG